MWWCTYLTEKPQIFKELAEGLVEVCQSAHAFFTLTVPLKFLQSIRIFGCHGYFIFPNKLPVCQQLWEMTPDREMLVSMLACTYLYGQATQTVVYKTTCCCSKNPFLILQTRNQCRVVVRSWNPRAQIWHFNTNTVPINLTSAFLNQPSDFSHWRFMINF